MNTEIKDIISWAHHIRHTLKSNAGRVTDEDVKLSKVILSWYELSKINPNDVDADIPADNIDFAWINDRLYWRLK